MVVTLSLANGFQETVSQKVFSFWGHIRIEEKEEAKSVIAEESRIIKDDTLVQNIRKVRGVQSIHPFATKSAILKTRDDIEGVLVKGFDSTYDFRHLQPFIKEGRPIHFNDSSYSQEIMISAYTAAQLKLKLNDRILIYFIRPGSDPDSESAGMNIRARKLTISGIFKTGIEEYDKLFAIADIKLIQRLNDWEPDEVGGYEIFLDNYRKIDTVAYAIHELDRFPATWNAASVKTISPNIFDWLNMQDTTRNVLIGFMAFVAVINLITCLIILVLERIRMVGILKSLGATNWTIQKIFLRHSALITITGILIGAAAGLCLLWIQQATGFIKLEEDAYYLSTAAVKIVWWQIAAICIGTLLICFAVLMIPSIIVRKVQPVRAIQFR